jgi:hypothetical protein
MPRMARHGWRAAGGPRAAAAGHGRRADDYRGYDDAGCCDENDGCSVSSPVVPVGRAATDCSGSEG